MLIGNGDGSFLAPNYVTVSSAPYSLASEDFNREGIADLAFAALGDLVVNIGKGDGTFEDHVPYPVNDSPISVAVGDFNGDNKLDLVAACVDSASALIGNGDGSFQNAVDLNAGISPQFVTVGDFNGDEKLDLAVANSGSDEVSFLIGNGDGTFQSAPSVDVGEHPFFAVPGDFNNDGNSDLIVANDSVPRPVFALLNNCAPPQPGFGITLIRPRGLDVRGNWLAPGGSTNQLQKSAETSDGQFQTSTFIDIGPQFVTPANTNDPSSFMSHTYLDAGAATNGPSGFYRVKLVP